MESIRSLACLSPLAALLWLPLAEGRSFRLSPLPAVIPFTDVQTVFTSPDQEWIVFVTNADGSSEGAVNLFSVPSDGSAPARKLAEHAEYGLVSKLVISPDESRVVYRFGTDLRRRLFSVPIDGSGAPVELVGEHVLDFLVTPDSARVVFTADLATFGRFLLWSLPIDGGVPLEESGPLVAGGDVDQFALTPDGTRAVYRASANAIGIWELFSTPLGSGGDAVRLNAQPPPNGEVEFGFVLTPDGTRVVYRADQLTNGVIELFGAPVDGSASSVRISAPLPPGKNVQTGFLVGAARAIYRAEPDGSGSDHLLSAPVDGSAAATVLSKGLPAGADVRTARLSPDGTRVVYRATNAGGASELFSAPVDGSAAPIRLNAALLAGETVQDGFQLAPLGALVVFTAGPSGSNVLQVAPLDGSSAPLVLDAEPATTKTGLQFAPTALRVAYRKSDSEGRTRVWSARIDAGSAPVALSAGTTLNEFHFAANGTAVLYTSDDHEQSVMELFARNSSGAGSAVQFSPDFPATYLTGSVGALQVAGSRAVYVASTGAEGILGPPSLYSVPIAEGSVPTCISAGSSPPIQVWGVPTIGSEGTRAVFLGTRTGSVELFSVPVTGSTPPLALSGPMTVGGGIPSHALTSDGATVVYLADQETDEQFELYSAALDGSTPAAKRSGALAAGRDVLGGYRATADGARVVYVADADVDEQYELWSSAGGGPPVRLNGALIASGDVVSDPLLSPDEAWVFFRADATIEHRFELFRAPIDGSAPAVAIASFATGGRVEGGFRPTPDGSRVVFVASSVQVAQRRDLFGVPADGSAPPLLLNTVGSSSDVSSLLLDPSGTRAVFVSGGKLHAVPVDGSAPQTLLAPLAAGEWVRDPDAGGTGVPPAIQFDPSGTRVLFVVESNTYERVYVAPLDASAPPLRLDAPSGTFPEVPAFRVAASGARVAYLMRALQPSGLRQEIFEVPIQGGRAPIQLNPTGIPGSSVQPDFVFGPLDATLLFRLDASQVSSHALYAALLERQPRRRGL